MRQCHRCGCEIDDLMECCPGCMGSVGELLHVEISKEEIAALEKCDAILEGLQTDLRGGCKVKTIRALIAKRLDSHTEDPSEEYRYLKKRELDALEDQKNKADKLWGILVMLKRGFDTHSTNSNKLEIDRTDWEEAVKRATNLKH